MESRIRFFVYLAVEFQSGVGKKGSRRKAMIMIKYYTLNDETVKEFQVTTHQQVPKRQRVHSLLLT